MIIGESLKEHREKSGYNKTELADEISVSVATVRAWEENTSEPGLFAVWEVADLYGVSIDELIGRMQRGEKVCLL